MIKSLKWPIGAVVSIFIVALLAAGPVIYRHSIEYDEAISLLVTAGHPFPAWPESVVSAGSLKDVFNDSAGPVQIAEILRRSDVHPPLYFWFLAGWQTIFGKSIEAARFFSLFCMGVAAFMLTGLIISAGGSTVMAVVTNLFLLLSPMGVYAATTSRPYALAMMLVAGAAWTAYESFDVSRPEYPTRVKTLISLTCGFLSGLAVLCHYLAAISIVLIGLWIAAFGVARRKWLTMVNFAFGAAIPLMPAAWMLIGQLGSRPDQFGAFEGISLLSKISLAALKMLVPDGFFSPLFERFGTPLAFWAMSLAIAAGMVFAVIDIKRNHDRKTFWSLIASLGLGNIVGIVIASALTDKNLNYPRFIYAAIPCLACVAAFGCDFKYRKVRIGLLLALPILLIQFFWIYEAVVQLRTSQEWRTLVQFSRQQFPPEETLFLIDAGYGRGVPASMVYELPASAKVRVVTQRTNPLDLFDEVKSYRYLFTVMSWQREGNQRLSKFKQALLYRGAHHPRQLLLGRHQILEKKGE